MYCGNNVPQQVTIQIGEVIMIRKAAKAGSFYPAQPEHLRQEIVGYLNNKMIKKDAIGLIAPHAGYMYSGGVAGAVYSSITPSETFIILCPNHTGEGKLFSIMTNGIWQTPIGDVQIDFEFANKLSATSRYIQTDHLAHLYEHAIEVQLPFLQILFKNFQIVPICMGSNHPSIYKEIGMEIANCIKSSQKKVTIIASSDMSHEGQLNEATLEKYLKYHDQLAIDAILELNEDELIGRIEKLRITMCGYGPAIAMLTAAKQLGCKKGELIKYATSWDVTHDYSYVVGYAGIVVI
jgi:AmmeMemoRadiSam system protein B